MIQGKKGMQKDKEKLDEIHKLAADFYHDAGSKLFSMRSMGLMVQKTLPKLVDCYKEAVEQGKVEPLGRSERLGLERVQNGLTTTAQELTGLHKAFWLALDSIISGDAIRPESAEGGNPAIKGDAIHDSAPSSIENISDNQSGYRVLLVDDELTYQLVFTDVLRDCNCQVETAGDGLQALALVEQKRFDLVLMDVRMPNMDGFETTERIRRIEQNNGLNCMPIIGISDSPLDEDRRRGIEVGMNEFITKTQGYEGIAALLQRYPVRPPG